MKKLERWRAPGLTSEEIAALDAIDAIDWDSEAPHPLQLIEPSPPSGVAPKATGPSPKRSRRGHDKDTAKLKGM